MTARDHLIDKLNQIENVIKEVKSELKKKESNDPELIVASCNELALAMKEIAEHAYVRGRPPIYIVTVHETGKFKIRDTYHHKIVFRGKDCRMKSRASTSYEFASSDDMLATLHQWMSTSTYCKLVQALRS